MTEWFNQEKVWVSGSRIIYDKNYFDALGMGEDFNTSSVWTILCKQNAMICHTLLVKEQN